MTQQTITFFMGGDKIFYLYFLVSVNPVYRHRCTAEISLAKIVAENSYAASMSIGMFINHNNISEHRGRPKNE